jgi:putative colanic acid biosynthesis glycosyltransferase
MTGPLFSVVTPVYNDFERLNPTLDSVEKQDNSILEHLVIDDGSTDATPDKINQYQKRNDSYVRILQQENQGTYGAMNTGINQAQGKYLFFLNAGDRFREDVLPALAEFTRDQPEILYGNVYHEKEQRLFDGKFSKAELCIKTIPHQAEFFHHTVFNRVGDYDTNYHRAGDYHLNLRCVGDPEVELRYLDNVITDYEGGGYSERTPDEPFFNDKPEIIRNSLGQSFYDFYMNSGLRFNDLLRFTANKRFLLVGTGPGTKQTLEHVEHTAEAFRTENTVMGILTSGDVPKKYRDSYKIYHDSREVLWESVDAVVVHPAARGTTIFEPLNQWEGESILTYPTQFSPEFLKLLTSDRSRSVHLYGTGRVGQYLYEYIEQENQNRTGELFTTSFVTGREQSPEDNIDSIPVISPSELSEDGHSIVIATHWIDQVRDRLEKEGISQDRVINAIPHPERR